MAPLEFRLGIAGDFKDSFYSTGVQAFMSEGRSYGLPDSVGPIVFWYNKELCERAGVDPSAIKDWEDLLDAVKKCKQAGITPMAVGGSDFQTRLSENERPLRTTLRENETTLIENLESSRSPRGRL
jgi:ABC-type glycerol-3-phosphate transport system substrate-binding protein